MKVGGWRGCLGGHLHRARQMQGEPLHCLFLNIQRLCWCRADCEVAGAWQPRQQSAHPERHQLEAPCSRHLLLTVQASQDTALSHCACGRGRPRTLPALPAMISPNPLVVASRPFYSLFLACSLAGTCTPRSCNSLPISARVASGTSGVHHLQCCMPPCAAD
jgi:hypothetical protein